MSNKFFMIPRSRMSAFSLTLDKPEDFKTEQHEVRLSELFFESSLENSIAKDLFFVLWLIEKDQPGYNYMPTIQQWVLDESTRNYRFTQRITQFTDFPLSIMEALPEAKNEPTGPASVTLRTKVPDFSLPKTVFGKIEDLVMIINKILSDSPLIWHEDDRHPQLVYESGFVHIIPGIVHWKRWGKAVKLIPIFGPTLTQILGLSGIGEPHFDREIHRLGSGRTPIISAKSVVNPVRDQFYHKVHLSLVEPEPDVNYDDRAKGGVLHCWPRELISDSPRNHVFGDTGWMPIKREKVTEIKGEVRTNDGLEPIKGQSILIIETRKKP